jgi:hypothetical protein
LLATPGVFLSALSEEADKPGFNSKPQQETPKVKITPMALDSVREEIEARLAPYETQTGTGEGSVSPAAKAITDLVISRVEEYNSMDSTGPTIFDDTLSSLEAEVPMDVNVKEISEPDSSDDEETQVPLVRPLTKVYSRFSLKIEREICLYTEDEKEDAEWLKCVYGNFVPGVALSKPSIPNERKRKRTSCPSPIRKPLEIVDTPNLKRNHNVDKDRISSKNKPPRKLSPEVPRLSDRPLRESAIKSQQSKIWRFMSCNV